MIVNLIFRSFGKGLRLRRETNAPSRDEADTRSIIFGDNECSTRVDASSSRIRRDNFYAPQVIGYHFTKGEHLPATDAAIQMQPNDPNNHAQIYKQE